MTCCRKLSLRRMTQSSIRNGEISQWPLWQERTWFVSSEWWVTLAERFRTDSEKPQCDTSQDSHHHNRGCSGCRTPLLHPGHRDWSSAQHGVRVGQARG